MNKKFIWLIVSCLMVAALVLASCAPAVVEEKKATVVTKEPEKKAEEVEEVVEAKTKYGGVIHQLSMHSPGAFDVIDTIEAASRAPSHDSLLQADWWISRDLFAYSCRSDYAEVENFECWVGGLAESWEQPDNLTLIFHIRKGVRWQNKPPVNGREFVADDVEWHFKRLLGVAILAEHAYALNIDSVEATDKYTVVFKLKQPWIAALRFIGVQPGAGTRITPREAVEYWGDLRDWRSMIGTGPFMIEDYVIDSCLTYSRNPDYWDKDPDGNQLPYADGAKIYTMPDRATQIAALRTGAVDFMDPYYPVPWDQRDSLEKSNPELQWAKAPDGGVWTIWLNNSIEPFNDIRVRQALSMATNRQEINDSIFGGTSTTFSWPARHSWSPDIFIPLDELQENVREIYTYNPEKAKELLAEAGYPTFTFKLDYWAGGERAIYAQVIQLVKAYWAKVGVDVELIPLERATFDALKRSFEYEALACGGTQGGASELAERKFRTGTPLNRSQVSDSHLDDLLSQGLQEFDSAKRNEILRELYLYMTEQCHTISMPTQSNWSAWQPWLKGYQGEFHGHGGALKYVWLDLELRKELTGR